MPKKPTPGPWIASQTMIKDYGPSYCPIIATTLIARVYSTAFGDDEQALANACIMAASHALLESLEEMVMIVEIATKSKMFGYPEFANGPLPKAILAIKKARGNV